jgi:hypothetical protein
MAVAGHMSGRMFEHYHHVRTPRNERPWRGWNAVRLSLILMVDGRGLEPRTSCL